MLTRLLPLFVLLSEGSLTLKRRAAAQGLVEYAVILMLMAIVVIGIMSTLGKTLCTAWYEKLVVDPSSPFHMAGASCNS